jgi:hypothetical protein
MSRRLTATLIGAGLCLAMAATAWAQSTTRIEPRPFYGATVTIEEGVRVFRPLPPERHVIINPNNTPLNLSISDTTVTQHSTSVSRSDNTHRHYGTHHRRFIPSVGGY